MNFKSLLMSAITTTEKARPDWVVNSFPIIKLIIVIAILLCAIFMIVSVMMQEGNSNGMTGITGDSADTFYNRNKGQSMQGKIKKATIVVAILILVLCLAYLVLNTIYSGGLV